MSHRATPQGAVRAGEKKHVLRNRGIVLPQMCSCRASQAPVQPRVQTEIKVLMSSIECIMEQIKSVYYLLCTAI